MESSSQQQELFYQIALSSIPEIGPIVGKSLIGYCGSANAVFTSSKKLIAKIPGIGPVNAAIISNFKDFAVAEREMNFVLKNNIRGIHFTSPDYPIRLKQNLDSPIVLFVKGNVDLNHHRFVAIVGTRKNTEYGSEITKKIVADLKPYDVHIISGLAYGIDICAHRASLDNQIPTVGVVGHGLDILYPGSHKSSARQMIESGGAVLTEFFSGTALNKDLFPRRNRIVAGLCDAIVIIESLKRGGSMITADIASSYNKDVFALAGRANDPMSEGCNFLIKSLKAGLCENAEDIANGMNWFLEDGGKPKTQTQTSLLLDLNEEEKKVFEILNTGIQNYDEILFQTQIPVNKLSYLLLDLEMKGFLNSMPGKKYSLCR